PANGSTIPNPLGNLTITGTASATNGVSAVNVGVQSDGGKGPWWNASTQTWTPGIWQTAATLALPGATSTSWSLTLPVPAAGINLQVFSSAVDGGVADIS